MSRFPPPPGAGRFAPPPPPPGGGGFAPPPPAPGNTNFAPPPPNPVQHVTNAMSGVSLNGGAPPPPPGGGGFAPPPPPQPASNRVVLFSMTSIYENVYILYDAGKNNLHLPSVISLALQKLSLSR
eukprot:scaffold5520_cov167-Amphora_coffeaeformis.AAC.1